MAVCKTVILCKTALHEYKFYYLLIMVLGEYDFLQGSEPDIQSATPLRP